ncbi:transglutaminase domain-containing protein [archaeon]|jgi:transglutaminase-like putative cysteine protease|nr:transglutaminase domain-containing protein [archaeon]
MKRGLLLLFLLLIPLASAQYHNISEIQTSVDITANIEVIPDAGYQFNQITANIEFFPKNYNYQSITSQQISATPDATTTDDISITWDSEAEMYEYNIDSLVETKNYLIQTNKQTFPRIAEEELEFTLETEYIDITEAIENKAIEITEGETDLYKAVFKLADWTEKNIQYNLTTLSVNTVQQSSWVLENREGVCDEITNLFISMCRSLGIPAKFISGIAYTNILNDFGPHGWAEVYIDGEWVPFDVTYAQFGWTDPAHIKFNEIADPYEATVSYEWSGQNFQIQPSQVEIQADILETTNTIDSYLEMEINPLYNQVGENSYIPFEVELTNNNNYYVPARVTVTIAPGLTEINNKPILLEPNQKKSLFWIATIPEDLNSNLIYTTRLQAQTNFGTTSEAEITYSTNYDTITQEQAESIIEELDIQDQTDFLSTTTITCQTENEVYYSDQTPIVICELEGETAEVCIQDDCQEDLTFEITETQSQRMVAIATKNSQSTYSYFDLIIIEKPELTITATPMLDYTNPNPTLFTLQKTGEIHNLSITLGATTTVFIPNPQNNFTINLAGRDFLNNIALEATYLDKLNKQYEYNTDIAVQVENIPLIQKIILWIKNLF